MKNTQNEFRIGRINKDRSGKKFGKLTIVSYFGTKGQGRTYYNCKCDCGKSAILCIHTIVHGNTKSCGCLKNRSGPTDYRWQGCGEMPKRAFHAIEVGAKRRDLEFNLTMQYLLDLFLKQDRKCALSGIDICFSKAARSKGKDRGTASIDRIDSSKGYIEGNVQWVHKVVNVMKWQLSQQEFINWCKMIATYNKDLN